MPVMFLQRVRAIISSFYLYIARLMTHNIRNLPIFIAEYIVNFYTPEMWYKNQ